MNHKFFVNIFSTHLIDLITLTVLDYEYESSYYMVSPVYVILSLSEVSVFS